MDEVFGEDNFITEIVVKKKGSQKSSLLDPVNDFVLWYSRSPRSVGITKFRTLFEERVLDSETVDEFSRAELLSGEVVNLKSYVSAYGEAIDFRAYPRRIEQEFPGARLFRPWPITNGGERANQMDPVPFRGVPIKPPKGNCWRHTSRPQEKGLSGMQRILCADRLVRSRSALDFKRYLDDFPYKGISNWWDGFGGASDQIYVVQTNERIVERCILMASDPGDLILDPTCGSGTTAYVAEQWGRRWITIDTSRVALALARARIMGARYPYYLLADSRDGQMKEAEVTRSAPSEAPTHGNIRHGFVYRRCSYITSGLIANNAEIDVIWEQWQTKLETLRETLNKELKKVWREWEIPREANGEWSSMAKQLHADWWEARIARQKEIDASIASKAEPVYLYDKPFEDNKKVRVAGPFTVESLSPHRVLGVDEHDELIDGIAESADSYGDERGFVQMILEHLKTAGVQQAHKDDKITFTSLTPWPGDLVCAEGRYIEGEVEAGREKRAAIFIGPEFGTVSRPDLVAAAREAGDADFDVLIACAFNYDAHSSEFDKLGRIPVLKARMNADLHMADDLKNTGKGNLFVIFGEPDIIVASEEWLVDRSGRRVAPYEIFKLVSGVNSLAEINRLGREDLCDYAWLSCRGEVWDYIANAAGGDIYTSKHRRRTGAQYDWGVSAVAWHCAGLSGGTRNLPDIVRTLGASQQTGLRELAQRLRRDQQDASRADEVAIQSPLITIHYSQVTIYGVDVFHPQTGEVRSDGAEGIACWFVDTDYNEESFFVRHAYFLGANDPYKSLKTTLKAEINQEAWATLYRDTSRPFDKPTSGRIAVKVINHLGDEVMKVFRVR